MQQLELSISVTGANSEEANQNAIGLMDALRGAADDIKVRRQRADNRTMELGTIVVAVVSSAAVSALCNGIADWLRGANTTIKIRNGQREVQVGGLSSPDAVKAIESLCGS